MNYKINKQICQDLPLTFLVTNVIVLKILNLVLLIIFINQKYTKIQKLTLKIKSLKRNKNLHYKIHFLMVDFQLAKPTLANYLKRIMLVPNALYLE